MEEHKTQAAEHQVKERLVHKLQHMNVSEKIKLALKGGSETRSILLKDSNKQVMLSVLENPQITDSEIERVARNRSGLEDALRMISKNKEWMKNYAIVMALATNPKTPVGIAIRLISRLKKKDLKLLEKNKGVSEVIRMTAKKIVKAGEEN